MNLPINQVAAHLHAVSPDLATKFLSGAYNPEKDYDEKKFLTSSWETATSLYPILSDELLRCFDGSDFTASDIITSPQPITVYLRLPEGEFLARTSCAPSSSKPSSMTCNQPMTNDPAVPARRKVVTLYSSFLMRPDG